jgi:hypothetical protein
VLFLELGSALPRIVYLSLADWRLAMFWGRTGPQVAADSARGPGPSRARGAARATASVFNNQINRQVPGPIKMKISHCSRAVSLCHTVRRSKPERKSIIKTKTPAAVLHPGDSTVVLSRQNARNALGRLQSAFNATSPSLDEAVSSRSAFVRLVLSATNCDNRVHGRSYKATR